MHNIRRLAALTLAAVALVLGGASAAQASTVVWLPASGAYSCNGISVALQHEYTSTSSGTAHRVRAAYVGSATTGGQYGPLTQLVFREQNASNVSIGGVDVVFSGQPTGWSRAFSLNEAPYHVGTTKAAFDISTWSPVGDIHHRCTITL